MKLLSWNCRGLRNPSTIRNIRNLLRSCGANVVFLSETHVTANDVFPFLQFGFDMYYQVPAVTHWKGGLLLLWYFNTDLQVLYSDQFIIHVSIKLMDQVWQAAFIYGEPNRSFRRAFWVNVTNMLKQVSAPLLCCGDFNDLLQIRDKSGGLQVKTRNTSNLRYFTNYWGLLDLGFNGPAYTWSNNQPSRFHIRERLDRAFSNAECTLLFPNAAVHHLPRFSSDHSPILLTLCPKSVRRRRRFMFKNHWCYHSDFPDIISTKWTSISSDSTNNFLENCNRLVLRCKDGIHSIFRIFRIK